MTTWLSKCSRSVTVVLVSFKALFFFVVCGVTLWQTALPTRSLHHHTAPRGRLKASVWRWLLSVAASAFCLLWFHSTVCDSVTTWGFITRFLRPAEPEQLGTSGAWWLFDISSSLVWDSPPQTLSPRLSQCICFYFTHTIPFIQNFRYYVFKGSELFPSSWKDVIQTCNNATESYLMAMRYEVCQISMSLNHLKKVDWYFPLSLVMSY